MMHEEVKQIIAAPGWRVWIADYIVDGQAKEIPVIGWGVVKYTNDDADVEDLNLSSKTFTSVDLVVYYSESSISVRLIHRASILVLPPNQEITADDKAELEEDAASGQRRDAENRKAILERHYQGFSARQIARELRIPRDEVQSTIYLSSLRKQRKAAA